MTTDRSTLSADAHPDDATENARRGAIARGLCARICDERKTFDDLAAVDALLDRIEREEQGEPEKLLAGARYGIEANCSMPEYRRGWNDAIDHALMVMRIDRCLAELVEAAPLPPAPDLELRLAEMARKLDEDRARNEALKREVAKQSIASRREFDISDEEPTKL